MNDLVDRLRRDADEWSRRYHDLERRLADSDGSVDASQAQRFLRQGQLDEAENALLKLVAKQEKDIQKAAATQYNLGEVLNLKNDIKNASAHFKRAVELNPSDYRYFVGLARSEYETEDYKGAEVAWKSALTLGQLKQSQLSTKDYNELRGGILGGLAAIYAITDRPREAEEAYKEAIRICEMSCKGALGSPELDLLFLKVSLGDLNINNGKSLDAKLMLDDVIASVRSGADADPRGHGAVLMWALIERANANLEMRDLKNSEKDYLSAIVEVEKLEKIGNAYTQNKVYILGKLAAVYMILRQPSAAADIYKRQFEALEMLGSIVDAVDLSIALNRLAVAKLDNGEADAALESLTKLIRISRSSQTKFADAMEYAEGMALLNLFSLFENKGDRGRATACLREGAERLEKIENRDLSYISAEPVDRDMVKKLHLAVAKRRKLPSRTCVQ